MKDIFNITSQMFTIKQYFSVFDFSHQIYGWENEEDKL